MLEAQEKVSQGTAPIYSRKNPFPARLLVNRRLTTPGAAKDTRHIEISITGSGLTYKVGDALGIKPSNWPDLVDEVLQAMGHSGEEIVPGSDGTDVSLRVALTDHYDITNISRTFFHAFADKTEDSSLERLHDPELRSELDLYLDERELIDFFTEYPSVRFEPVELVKLLRKLQVRLYSIASSPAVSPDSIHLTVAVVSYVTQGRTRKGVCSNYLADRVDEATRIPVFIHANKNFGLPADPEVPIIMIGPGTGIAPFRAFLHERRATGAPGRNWLFFGEQYFDSCFYYREEFEEMVADGTLARLDTAFSRDQDHKIYVQHRMLENSRELFAWLEAGACFYVCGDAKKMARDVHEALLKIIETEGKMTPAEASDYVKALQANHRYERDVY